MPPNARSYLKIYTYSAILVAACGCDVATEQPPISESSDVAPVSASTSTPESPKKPEPETPDGPPGMVWIPPGEFTMGSDSPMSRSTERPAHRVYVDGFWMDRTEVTNAQFRRFVEATGYVTIAEQAPKAEDILAQLPPGTPPPEKESLVPGSLVFTPTSGPVPLDDLGQWWRYVRGASWKHPRGPESSIDGMDDHPVVQVAWADAVAYAKWAGKRLPTEAEWEKAARGGLERKEFVWGDDPPDDPVCRANLWQGGFPYQNLNTDRFTTTAPVASFPPNKFGLVDMSGNVWELCSDWYRVDTYETRARAQAVARNPTGPEKSHDPREIYTPKRVVRGGSFLCNDVYCTGYRPSARMPVPPDTGLSHTGFRCVMTAEMWRAAR
jgi:formylglycine-generating enzyme required for sulfatase activity